MTELVEFLRARYDERERIALAAGGRGPTGQWHTPDGDMWAGRVEDAAGDIVVYDEGSPTEAQAAHIADNDPAGTLAEVDAKRRIMAIHHPRKFEGMGGLPQICDGCGYGGICDDPITEDINDCPILRVLALPHAGHPDYRSEWAVAK